VSTGKGWEAVLAHWCRTYHEADRATWQQNHPKVRMLSRIGRDGSFRARWDGRGACDFSGELRPDGRGWTCDAKDCEGVRWPFGELLRDGEDHQARRLEGCHRMGGLAFVALRLGGGGWVLPWAELGPRWWAWRLRGERPASWRPADGWGLRMPEPGDWLGAINTEVR
jgi:hypothetical protein